MREAPQSLECLQPANAILGESPSWDAAAGVLYWIDGKHPALFRWQEGIGQSGHWPMPQPVGCVASARSGQVVFADAAGLGLLELQSGEISRINRRELSQCSNQLNDGKVDRAGRFWVGSMDVKEKEAVGCLYRLDPDFSIHCVDRGFICSNGLGWSPDNHTMYFTDSVIRTIFAYEYDLTSGAQGARRVFATLDDGDGLPDGLTVDSEGFVWSAIWDGWRLIRYAPDGSIDQEVRLPVQRPTSCSFGGLDLKTLFITSASDGLSALQLQQGPLAGALFALHTDVAGLPETPFAGGRSCRNP